jgi:hypothetical protein
MALKESDAVRLCTAKGFGIFSLRLDRHISLLLAIKDTDNLEFKKDFLKSWRIDIFLTSLGK